MSSSLDKLRALASKLENKLEEQGKVVKKEENTIVEEVQKPEPIATPAVPQNIPVQSSDTVREENLQRVQNLYTKLQISEKSPDFDTVFHYKAMNLSGIGLKEDDFGEIREGKYIQVIAITYEPDKNGKKKAKNISLGYFGKGETLESVLKNEIIEFVLRWRYEKAFQNLEHYKDLIAKIEIPQTLF